MTWYFKTLMESIDLGLEANVFSHKYNSTGKLRHNKNIG